MLRVVMSRSLLAALVCVAICSKVSPQDAPTLDEEVARARSLFDGALVAFESGAPDEYRKLLADSVEAVISAPGATFSSDAAELLTELGDHAQSTHDSAEALRIFEWLAEYCERQYAEDHPSTLLILQRLAVSRRELDDLDGARELQERVLEVYERTLALDSFELAAARANLAGTLADLGDLPGALALEEAALTIFERSLPSDDSNLLAVRGNLAFHKLELGDVEGALELQRAIVAALETSAAEDPLQLGWALVRLGAVEQEMGRISDAQSSIERGLLELQGNLPSDHLMLASARVNLAGTLAELGDLAAARVLQQEALAVYADQLEPDDWELVAAKSDLAYLLSETGDHRGAIPLQEEVVEQLQRLLPPEHPDILNARHELVLSLLATGENERALEIIQAAIQVAQSSLASDDLDLAAARLTLARVHEATGSAEAARELLVSILTMTAQSLAPTHPDLAAARADLAKLMMRAGELEAARPLVAQIVDTRDRTLPPDDPDRLDAHVMRMHVLLGLDLDEAAQGALFSLVDVWIESLAGRVVYAHAERPFEAVDAEIEQLLLDADVRWKLAGRDRKRIVEALETHRYVSSGAPIRRLPGADVATLRDQAADARVQLRELTESVTPVNEELRKRLVTKYDTADRQIRQRLTASGTSLAKVGPDAIAAKLASGQVAVGFRRYIRTMDKEGRAPTEDRFLALVITPIGAVQRIELGRADRIDALVAQWRAAAGFPLGTADAAAPSLEEAGKALSERIIDPILRRLGDEVDTWVTAVDDVLHLVPLEALPLGEGLVADRYEIAYELSFADVIGAPHAVRGENQWVAVGGPRFDAQVSEANADPRSLTPPVEAGFRANAAETYESLDATLDEVERVAKIFREAFEAEPSVLIRAHASKPELRAAAPQARWIHIATHDYMAPRSLDEDSEFSPGTLVGWALAGANRGRDFTGRVPGILTAEELASMDLSQCDLAVLSASETTERLDHASFGWQRALAALHGAGIRTTVSSLWKVSDEAKTNFLRSFYRRLWKDGDTKTEAFRAAIRAIRASGAPVSDWAAWRLVGNRG